MIANSILDIIGNTPVIRLNRMAPPNVSILVKVEKGNPGGSVKDRAALRMIEDAERSGALTKDKIILEATSGNTGIALAMVAAVKGYRLQLVIPKNASVERMKILKAYGAMIMRTPAEAGMDGAIAKANELAKQKRYFHVNQFGNQSNIAAHYDTTALELLEDVPEMTHLVVAMGTTGTLSGISKRIREKRPDVKIIGVEPYPCHRIQGLKNMDAQLRPPIYDESIMDEKINVDDESAFQAARDLVRKEGIFAGMSSGAAVAGAIKVAAGIASGTVVTILPDGGEKYLSTQLFKL